MDSLVKEAPNKFKLNYNLFKLDAQEKEIMREMQNKKRNFFNPKDPYFKRKIFDKGCNGVYDTDKVIGIISPRDHTLLLNSSREQIRQNSKDNMSLMCDKDREFYGAGLKISGVNSLTPNHRSNKDQEFAKPQRKHDKVRQLKEEFEKISRIERELSNSIELCQVQKLQDIDDFEGFTNRDFNRGYEVALLNSNQTVRPLIKSRATRRREAQENGFKVSESQISGFTFKSRYARNTKYGRTTSTIDFGGFNRSIGAKGKGSVKVNMRA